MPFLRNGWKAFRKGSFLKTKLRWAPPHYRWILQLALIASKKINTQLTKGMFFRGTIERLVQSMNDGVIKCWAKKKKRKMYYHSPTTTRRRKTVDRCVFFRRNWDFPYQFSTRFCLTYIKLYYLKHPHSFHSILTFSFLLLIIELLRHSVQKQ